MSFHTARVKTGKAQNEHMFSAVPQLRTSVGVAGWSLAGQLRTHVRPICQSLWQAGFAHALSPGCQIFGPPKWLQIPEIGNTQIRDCNGTVDHQRPDSQMGVDSRLRLCCHPRKAGWMSYPLYGVSTTFPIPERSSTISCARRASLRGRTLSISTFSFPSAASLSASLKLSAVSIGFPKIVMTFR
jgi:hypothetical protein